MEEITHRSRCSKKKIKPITELVTYKHFKIPLSYANDHDPNTKKPCIMVRINGTTTYVPVDQVSPISYEVFCVLKDNGIITAERTFEVGVNFDPVLGYEFH